MSGTSSSTSSSTSAFGSFSSSRPGAVVHQHDVAGAQLGVDQLVGQLGDALLVGAADDERPPTVVEELLEGDDLAGALGCAHHHHVVGLVEHDLGAGGELVGLDRGADLDAHLAARRLHVDGAVVVDAQQRGVGGRRLGELVDLVAERGDVVAGLTQRVAELLVLADRLGELTLGLEQALLERAHPLRCVLEAADHRGDLVLELADLLPQRLDVVRAVELLVVHGRLPRSGSCSIPSGPAVLPRTGAGSAPRHETFTGT